MHVSLAKQVPSGFFDDIGNHFVVDHGRTANFKPEFVISSEGPCHIECTLDLCVDLLLDLHTRESQGSCQFYAIGNHVFCKPSVDRTNADRSRFKRIQSAGDNSIESKNYVCQQVEWIDRFIGMRSMPAFACDRCVPAIDSA